MRQYTRDVVLDSSRRDRRPLECLPSAFAGDVAPKREIIAIAVRSAHRSHPSAPPHRNTSPASLHEQLTSPLRLRYKMGGSDDEDRNGSREEVCLPRRP